MMIDSLFALKTSDLGSAGIDTSQKLLRGPDEPHLLLKKSETRKKVNFYGKHK